MPKRGSGKLYELNGERHTLTEWCRLYGVPVQRTQGRISRGNYTLYEALTTPQENPIQSRRRKEARIHEKGNGDNRRETACR
jgi:hypothetical protein